MDYQTLYNQLEPVAIILLGGGVAVSVLAELLKKVFGLNSKKVIHFLVAALAFVAAGLQYVTSLHNLPPQVLGVSTPAIYGFSQFAYIFVSKVSGFLGRVDVTLEDKNPASTLVATEVAPTVASIETVVAPTEPVTTVAPVDNSVANF